MFMEHAPRVLTALQQARYSVKAAANSFEGQLRIALSDDDTYDLKFACADEVGEGILAEPASINRLVYFSVCMSGSTCQ